MSRRKYKKRKRNRRNRRIGILPVFCVVGVLACLIIGIVFPLKNIVTVGNVHVTAQEVMEKALIPPTLQNTLLTKLFNSNRKIGGNGFIDSLDTKITGRNSVRITVSERRMIGAIEDNGVFWYIDTNGMVQASSEKKKSDDKIPIVNGLELKAAAVVGSVLPIQGTKPFVLLDSLKSLTEQYQIVPQRVIFSENSTMTLLYGDVSVKLGDGTNLDVRIAELAGILEKMEPSAKGTLHLERFERSGNPIVFDKN